MENVSRYILAVCSAAVICGLVKSLTVKKGPAAELVHMMCGVFLAVTAISPLLKIHIGEISSFAQSYQWDAEQIAAIAQQEAGSAMNDIIISQAESYIKDKAASLNTVVEVEVMLSDGSPGLPCGAVIRGNVSPYAKTRLTEILESDLGISREAQQWKS